MFALSRPAQAQACSNEGTPNPVVNASIQAPSNIWYTGTGNLTNKYASIQYWNGKAFQVPAGISTNASLQEDAGQAVLSLSPTNSWMVANGHTRENPIQVFHFDGTARHAFPSPHVVGAAVNALAAVNAHDVWAVGSAGPLLRSFIMHWNGTNWQAIDAPRPMVQGNTNILYGVDARAANDVWAVGTERKVNGGDIPLILHWDGKRWSNKGSPAADGASFYYQAVAALSATNVWAVGTGGVIGHWDGNKWQVVVPSIRSSAQALNAISAYSPRDIWAVGQKYVCNSSGSCGPVTFVEHWDGQAWRVVSCPSFSYPDGSAEGSLIAVKAFSPKNVWAVGGTTSSVFLEQWNGQRWQIVAQHSVLA